MTRIGGSFAPPLDLGALKGYRDLAFVASGPVAEAMQKLARMVEVFQETPESTLAGTPHPATIDLIDKSGKPIPPMMVVPLEQAEITRIDERVPWDHEIEGYRGLFEALPTGSLRNAAFHLLWFAIELSKDREPLTSDKLSV